MDSPIDRFQLHCSGLERVINFDCGQKVEQPFRPFIRKCIGNKQARRPVDYY